MTWHRLNMTVRTCGINIRYISCFSKLISREAEGYGNISSFDELIKGLPTHLSTEPSNLRNQGIESKWQTRTFTKRSAMMRKSSLPTGIRFCPRPSSSVKHARILPSVNVVNWTSSTAMPGQLSWLLASTWRHTLLPFFRCPLLYSCQTLPFFRQLLYSCQTLPFFRRLLYSCQTLPFFRQLLYSCQTTPPGQMGQFQIEINNELVVRRWTASYVAEYQISALQFCFQNGGFCFCFDSSISVTIIKIKKSVSCSRVQIRKQFFLFK